MHNWLLFLAGTAVYGMSRTSEPDLSAVNFAKPVGGWRLNGSIIKELEVDSRSCCSFECVKEERCLSYKFGVTKKTKNFICQLTHSDRFSGWANFTKDKNFTYVGIKASYGN